MAWQAAVAGAAGGIIGNLINMGTQAVANSANRRMNTENNLTNIGLTRETNALNERLVTMTNEQNRELQYEAWHREDNAVQRRAADMAAAGFNPLLAAGAAAQSSGPVRVEAPQHQAPQTQAGRVEALAIETGIIERALRMRDEFATSAKQREMNDAIIQEHKVRTKGLQIDNDYKAKQFGLNQSHVGAQIDHLKKQGRSLDQAYNFNTEANALSLLQTRQSITNLGLEETIKSRQATLLETQNLHMTEQSHGLALDNIRKAIENEYAQEINSGKVTHQELEITALEVANELARHNTDLYRDLGSPSNANIPTQIISVIATQASRVFDFVIGRPLRYLGIKSPVTVR